MTRPCRLAADAMGMLRHIEVHGPRTRAEVAKGCTGNDTSKTLANLSQLGYVAADHTTRPATYGLTSKARRVLGEAQAQGQAPGPAIAQTAPTPARAAPQPMPKPAPRQAKAPAAAAAPPRARKQPTPRTMAAVQHLVLRPWAMGGQAAGEPKAHAYTGQETRRPSLRPGSMAAFSLPSRMGDRLHYRDGLVTDMAGNPVNPATHR
ncbi:MAG: hypothetical protein AB7I35_01485 [Ramlibacter sp.]